MNQCASHTPNQGESGDHGEVKSTNGGSEQEHTSEGQKRACNGQGKELMGRKFSRSRKRIFYLLIRRLLWLSWDLEFSMSASMLRLLF